MRPSLYQVTCGWGKLGMRGAGTTAPSPWETDCARSPSSKPPITARRQRQEALVRRGHTGSGLGGSNSLLLGVAMAPTEAEGKPRQPSRLRVSAATTLDEFLFRKISATNWTPATSGTAATSGTPATSGTLFLRRMLTVEGTASISACPLWRIKGRRDQPSVSDCSCTSVVFWLRSSSSFPPSSQRECGILLPSAVS